VDKLWHRHLMVNVLWSSNGWTDVDPDQRGKHQFKWTREHPTDHADAYIFDWDYLRDGGYAPMPSLPRKYMESGNDGEGLLFVASKNPKAGGYYIVGFFSECRLDPENAGAFYCNVDSSTRFATYLPARSW